MGKSWARGVRITDLEEAKRVAASLLWMQAHPLRTVHQQACVCAECEAMTQHLRVVADVNAGRYEVDELA